MVALAQALRQLRRRTMRSSLTAVGIAIGVAALVLLGALSEKMNRLVSGGRDFAAGQIRLREIHLGGHGTIEEGHVDRVAVAGGLARV